MKEPCVGYSGQALGAFEALEVPERLEVRKACLLMYDELQHRPEAGSGQDSPEKFHRRVGGCEVTYRRPLPHDRTVCCKRKVALWVIRIDGTDR
jgi:hypothetical protein